MGSLGFATTAGLIALFLYFGVGGALLASNQTIILILIVFGIFMVAKR